ncbi:phospholipid-binding lipoprotein MlaA [Acinetobacter calcoaceticus]|uniref:Phospholipid-binding lipoprotein MlaA n=1 Tax=Acinetobacter calcoaceticus TaxID=471 RepID=A0A4R1XTY3_ACICA|nr:phospholipid-binding lipoprotein MlaA [Acinetobacter calcoaceticus]
MHRFNLLWASMLSLGLVSQVFAQEKISSQVIETPQDQSQQLDITADEQSLMPEDHITKHRRLDALKELKNIKIEDLKVNANAAQADEVKDPLQPLNREIFKFNDSLDRNIARPLAVQYTQKVPGEVRGSYRLFRKNMAEPWNAVNQLVQGRPLRAAKTLGRFTVNTLTSLGLADPAGRMGLNTEEESLGTTLGYYGVPSGPYIMLPVLGPSTLRNSMDYVAESFAKPNGLLSSSGNNHESLSWASAAMGGIDSRSQFLDLDSVLQGDRYAAIRDIYLQRKSFEISEKKGNSAEAISFIDEDDSTDDFTDPQ